MREGNLETITDTQWWYQILPLNGFNLIRAKQILLRRRKRFYESFSSRRKCRKSFALTIHWIFVNPVKICHGIIELRHLIDLRRMVLLKERYAETKEGTFAVECLLYFLQSGFDEKWLADYLECLLSANCSRPLGRWENSL